MENKLVIYAKLSSKNQVTIPKQIRHELNLHAEDEIAFEVNQDGNIVLKKKPDEFWDIVAEQSVQYGKIEDEEIEWGDDVGEEVID